MVQRNPNTPGRVIRSSPLGGFGRGKRNTNPNTYWAIIESRDMPLRDYERLVDEVMTYAPSDIKANYFCGDQGHTNTHYFDFQSTQKKHWVRINVPETCHRGKLEDPEYGNTEFSPWCPANSACHQANSYCRNYRCLEDAFGLRRPELTREAGVTILGLEMVSEPFGISDGMFRIETAIDIPLSDFTTGLGFGEKLGMVKSSRIIASRHPNPGWARSKSAAWWLPPQTGSEPAEKANERNYGYLRAWRQLQ
jgi:hypothetical protein